MSRDPAIPAEEYTRIIKFLKEQGYDIDKLREVPQKDNQPA